jgi:predicted nuclease of restriction endonuclease-like RecB superfamily
MEIKIDSGKSIGRVWKEILRQVKRLGLMYWLETDSDTPNNIFCTVEGASNVIKLTEKYGSSIAKIVPLIFKADNWRLKADILRTTNKCEKTIYNFEISNRSHSDKISFQTLKALMSKEGNSIEVNNENNTGKKIKESSHNNKSAINSDFFFRNNFDFNSTVSYDSNIEKTFAQRFELSNTGWTIEREPEPLITKLKTAFISDFILTKHGNKVMVEIIGFWTMEYLKRKIQKIVQIIESYDNNKFYMILIINFENLAAYESNHIHQFSNVKNKNNILIVSYKNENIPLREIISFLKAIEKKYMDQNFENKIDKAKTLKETNTVLDEFRISSKTQITLGDLNESLKSTQQELDSGFNLKKIMENNFEFKSLIEDMIKSNGLIIVKDIIFKETQIKENLKELKEKRIESLKDACDFLTIKGIPETIHIDLIIYMGIKIYWNGLDYSKSKVIHS